MSHCSQQIRDWFVTTLTGVGGLPTAREGTPRQVASNTTACIVTTRTETIEQLTQNTTARDQRDLEVDVILIAGSLDAADALSVLAEHAIAGSITYPGADLVVTQREYDENIDTDRDYVSVTLSYLARYFTARNDVDSFT